MPLLPSQGTSIAPDLGRYERQLWDKGFIRIAGIDEVGRGPLAGPVVAAAVILPRDADVPPVRDSKTLNAQKRRQLLAQLRQIPGFELGIGVVKADEIDRINILQATYAAMAAAVNALQPLPDYALVDGRPVQGLPIQFEAIIKGDALCTSIAAASIAAKVIRDDMMVAHDQDFPGYGFEEHKGYGTAAHLAALRTLGPCPIHRRTFAPVASVINGGYIQLELDLKKPAL